MSWQVATKKIREYEVSKAIAHTLVFALSGPSGDSKMFNIVLSECKNQECTIWCSNQFQRIYEKK